MFRATTLAHHHKMYKCIHCKLFILPFIVKAFLIPKISFRNNSFGAWKLMSFSPSLSQWLSLPLKGKTNICCICFIRYHFVSFRCKLAQANGWGVMVSHRSGETEDTFIADLVVGLCTGQVSGHKIMVDTSVSYCSKSAVCWYSNDLFLLYGI